LLFNFCHGFSTPLDTFRPKMESPGMIQELVRMGKKKNV